MERSVSPLDERFHRLCYDNVNWIILVAISAQSIKLKIMEVKLTPRKWKKICALAIATTLGLWCGVAVWRANESRLMPDLSETPSVASYYAVRSGR
jgi:hypothetical protein